MRSILGVFSACLIAGGCTPREDPSILAVDPLNSIPAIQEAARQKDRGAIPSLIRQLDNDDPAIRFYSFSALHDLTGKTFGYHYFDTTEDRKPAVHQWREWAAKEKDKETRRPGDKEKR